MENFESENSESIKCDRDFILGNLKLVAGDELESSDFLKLEPDLLVDNINIQRPEKTPLSNPESLFRYFESVEIIEPDKICRPKGDTTFFTTAGVQYIETILREEGELKRKLFVIAQPVIRSQFMDKVGEGTSTSFVNFSIESIDSPPDEFINLCHKLIKLIVDQGVNLKELRFQIENTQDSWGNRKFTQTVLTVYFNDIELGECIYINDYPVTENKKVSITDIGFGVERLNWGVGNSKHYFSEFDKFYTEKEDADKVASVIDCIRTIVLIAGEGIKPSSHDHGYRLRQLSKRFVSRNQNLNIDITELIHLSYEFWKKWGSPNVTEDEVVKIIKSENERNYNGLFLSTLEKNGGPKIYVDINQSTTDFLKQISFSLPEEVINKIIEKMK